MAQPGGAGVRRLGVRRPFERVIRGLIHSDFLHPQLYMWYSSSIIYDDAR